MSPDLIAEMARIQHNERVHASLARAQYTAVDDEPRTASSRRSGSFTRRVLATVVIALGLGAGVVGTLNVVSNSDLASRLGHHSVESGQLSHGTELATASNRSWAMASRSRWS